MASIHLKAVAHAYVPDQYALMPGDIRFENGKTYALLGPSGCGKTTMLNIISGLIRPSEGSVHFGDIDVTGMPTARRNIAQVFQFPVIYQSKTVHDNLAFPLRCRRWNAHRIRARVQEVAEILGLASRLQRSARTLTADEKQLISLGRGLVRDDVAAILMDEPLTVIDPQMKFELRRKIRQANARTHQTMIYVTHDQNEAMSIADEVLVMEAGRVIQRDTPDRLFESPINTFVGHFIGSPGMNFIPLGLDAGRLAIGHQPLPGSPAEALARARAGQAVRLGIRPEHVQILEAAHETAFDARIVDRHDQGRVMVVDIEIGGCAIKAKVPRGADPAPGRAWVRFPAERVRFYAEGRLIGAEQST